MPVVLFKYMSISYLIKEFTEMGKKVKIKDIAIRLGLSSTLVSLVLNNKADKQGIKKETQESVLSVANQMGYFSQFSDSSIVEKHEEQPGIIGMVVTSLSDPFIIEISDYLQKAFASIGIGFSILTKDPSDKRFNKAVSTFKKFYTGIILAGDAADEFTVRSLRTINYPFIILENSISSLRLNIVKSDCEFGAELLVRHINKLHYKSITLIRKENITPFTIENISSVKREIKNVCDECKIYELVISKSGSSFNYEESDLDSLLRPPVSTQLIIVSEANLVYSLLNTLEMKKIRVPQDVAVVSLEDGFGFDLLRTPITRLKRDLPGMASKIARMIWSEINNKSRGKYRRSVTINPELIIGSSCGA